MCTMDGAFPREEARKEVHENPDAPRIANIMSGPRYPIGQVLALMGCLVWNFDFLLDPKHDIAQQQVRDNIDAQAEDSHITTSGPACGTFTRAKQICRPDHPGGGLPELRSQAHPLGLPEILARIDGDKDRLAVDHANAITLWLFRLLTKLAASWRRTRAIASCGRPQRPKPQSSCGCRIHKLRRMRLRRN